MSAESDIEFNTSRAENANVNTTAANVAVVDVVAITTTNMPVAATTTLSPATTVTTIVTDTTAPTTIDTTDTSGVAHMKTHIKNGENNNGSATAQAQQQQMQLQQQVLQTSTTTTATSTTLKDKMDSDAALSNFKVLYVVTQLCGLTIIVLMGCWVGVHMGGLAGTDNPALEFNWHPLLMTIGLIFLYGNSILIYRGFRNTRKKTLKITHASIHMAAFILTVIALKTVFDSHNLAEKPIPNMYSLHSWLGLSAVIIFCLQYVAGFMAYLVPGLKESYKIAYMPLHIYFGVFGFVLAIASALMGLTEKAIFSIKNYSTLPEAGVMANVCGVLFVVFGALVVYLISEPSYKRKPIPEDAVLLTGATE